MTNTDQSYKYSLLEFPLQVLRQGVMATPLPGRGNANAANAAARSRSRARTSHNSTKTLAGYFRASRDWAEKRVGSQLASTPRRGCLRLGTYHGALAVCADAFNRRPFQRICVSSARRESHFHDGWFRPAAKSNPINTLLSIGDRPAGGNASARCQPHFRLR